MLFLSSISCKHSIVNNDPGKEFYHAIILIADKDYHNPTMRRNLLSSALLFLIIQTNAQWNTDTLVRNAICTAANLQISPQLCTDGAKGAIIAWTDVRNSPSQIYAQRIDSNGIIKWTNNGLLATPGAPYVIPAYPVSDGSGGAIIVYELTVP